MIPEGDTRDTQFWKYPGATVTRAKAADDRQQVAFQAGTPWVKDALQLENAEKRRDALDAIGKAIGSADENAIRAGLSAFGRVGQVAFDKAAFRPALRKLLKHATPEIRASACGALAGTGKSSEDLQLVLPLTEDENGEVKRAAVWALKWLSGADFTGDVGRAVQKVLEAAGPDLRKELWGTMWGTKVSPELERIIVQASRDDDQGSGYSDVFYHALSVHQSKRELTVTRLLELLATEDPTNVGGRVLWGLQQGVEADQRPRVAAAAIQVIGARDNGYMRREAFRCANLYGTKQDAPAIRELLDKPGVTGDFREECMKLLATVEARE